MSSAVVRGVLFDWRGTLVHDPPEEWWVTKAFDATGMPPDETSVHAMCERLREASRDPEVIDAQATADCSAALHRDASMLHFRAAGVPDDIAEALYGLDFEAISHPFYADAEATLRSLRDEGCRVAIVSDIHFDLRPEFEAAGLDSCVDAYVLSFEHGIQKPDLGIFRLALDAIEVVADNALMVGDRPSRDGGAISAGITTLLLPPHADPTAARGLRQVLSLLHS